MGTGYGIWGKDIRLAIFVCWPLARQANAHNYKGLSWTSVRQWKPIGNDCVQQSTTCFTYKWRFTVLYQNDQLLQLQPIALSCYCWSWTTFFWQRLTDCVSSCLKVYHHGGECANSNTDNVRYQAIYIGLKTNWCLQWKCPISFAQYHTCRLTLHTYMYTRSSTCTVHMCLQPIDGRVCCCLSYLLVLHQQLVSEKH